MRQLRRKLAPALTLIALIAALPHCTRQVVLDDAPSAAEAGTGSALFAPDSGEAGADADPEAGPHVPMCATAECPAPYATCPGIPTYRCETNLTKDSQNCGACGNTCPGRLPPSLRMDMSCVDGACKARCQLQFLDCNGVPDDGCEVDPQNDPANCGGCGAQCAPGVKCIQRRCGCAPGTVECNGTCTDVTSDDANCGACGYDCKDHPLDAGALPPHMVNGCVAGHCGPKCDSTKLTFWANCNGTLADGCEINLRGDDNNCVACGRKCAPNKQCYIPPDPFGETAVADCHDPPGTCPAGQTMCSGVCVDLDSSRGNCGSCGFNCSGPLAADTHTTTTICEHARCSSTCSKGFGDCNGRSDDGCETDLSKDPHHCGACGASCDNALGQPCVAGACATKECDAGKVVH